MQMIYHRALGTSAGRTTYILGKSLKQQMRLNGKCKYFSEIMYPFGRSVFFVDHLKCLLYNMVMYS